MNQMERIPPHSDDAEKSVLGVYHIRQGSSFEVLEILSPGGFLQRDAPGDLPGHCSHLQKGRVGRHADGLEELKKRNTLEMAGGRYDCSAVFHDPVHRQCTQNAKIISEKPCCGA